MTKPFSLFRQYMKSAKELGFGALDGKLVTLHAFEDERNGHLFAVDHETNEVYMITEYDAESDRVDFPRINPAIQIVGRPKG